MSHALRCGIVLMGAGGLLLQVLLVRELITSFFGNELAIGLVLLNWLLLAALGSRLGTGLGSRATGHGPFVTLQLALAVVGPIAVLLSRAAGGRTMFPGEVVAPPAMLALSGLTVAPVCLLLGAQFAVACRLAELAGTGKRVAATVYALEALGAVAAGVVFHFILADHAGPLPTAMGVALFTIAAALWLERAGIRAGGEGPCPGPLQALRLAAGAALLCVWAIALFSPAVTSALDRRSLDLRWRGFDLAASVNSRYGNLAVTRAGAQVSFFQDGALLFTSEDIEAGEWAAHLALLQVQGPARALMIGPGYPATRAEARKHHAIRGTVLEMNATLVALAHRWLPGEAALDAHETWPVLITDARNALQRDETIHDAILVSAPDPTTTALNRYYTREFFTLCAARLSERGILSLRLAGHEAFITAERRLIHASVYRALADTFPEVWAIPGPEVRFIAARRPGVLARAPEALAGLLADRDISPRYVTPFSLEYALNPFAAEQYVRAIRETPAPPNSDLLPVTHSNYLRLWLRQYAGAGLRVLGLVERAPEGSRWLLLAAALLALAAWRPGLRAPRPRIACLVATVGFTLMGLQLLVLIGFQALAGYVYAQIGILTALHMGGLALGAWLGGARWALRWRGMLLPVLAVALCGLTYALGSLLAALQGALWAVPGALAAVALLSGILGGGVFPAAVAVFRLAGGEQARPAGILYAWDLVGGALAAALVGLLLIPALGLADAGGVVAAVGLAGALVAVPVCLDRNAG